MTEPAPGPTPDDESTPPPDQETSAVPPLATPAGNRAVRGRAPAERPLATLRIASLGAEGEGLARWRSSPESPEEIVHVPGALPGEEAEARIYRRKGNAAWGDLLRVVEASPSRVTPACSLFGICGGCQLQHLPYADQLAVKTRQVGEAFAGAGLDPTLVQDTRPCPRPLGYRSKLTPHFGRPRAGEIMPIGFLKIGRRQDVVDVPHCPLATDGINAALPAVRAEVQRDAVAGRYRLGASLLLREAASGVTSDPDALVTEEVGELALRFYARDFFQNNPFLLPAMVEHVVAAAAASGARALVDTYCGSGLFALAAARRFDTVVGVEVSPSAVERATENAAANGITHARFQVGHAAAVFAGVTSPSNETAVIVDPPRKGCDEAFLAQLAAFAPRAVVYVSCNPLTQARDVAWLAARGFTLQEVTPFDMFPQTRHLESVAVLDGPRSS